MWSLLPFCSQYYRGGINESISYQCRSSSLKYQLINTEDESVLAREMLNVLVFQVLVLNMNLPEKTV